MNKMIKFLVVVFLLCCSFNVYSESHDVIAKYSESQNVVTYEGGISNGISTIKADKGTFTLKVDSSDLNGVNVVVIKLSDDALSWIKNYTNSNDNYYFYFRKDDLDVNVSDKITIYYKSLDQKEKQIAILNYDGDIVSKGNNTISTYKTNFYVSISAIEKEKNSKKTLELDIDSNGKVMIDGTLYEGISNYLTDDSSVKAAIIPNNGYKVDNIKLNDVDITNSLKNGFVTVNLDSSSMLRVKFTLVDTKSVEDGYKISGKVIVAGEAVPDAVVILNDDVKTVTNASGEYYFENVPLGDNSILVMKDGKGIGFATFRILASDINEFETYDDDVFTIEMGQNNLTFVMDLKVNEDYSIDFKNVELSSDSNYLWLIVLGVVLVAGIIIIVVVWKNKDNK